MTRGMLERRLRRASALSIVLAGVAWGGSGVLVRAAYGERLTPRLNAILAGRDVHPVEHYLDLVAGPRAALASGFLGAALVLALLDRRATRVRLAHVISGGASGPAAFWRPAAASVIVAAAALRLPGLGRTSLWLDEAMISNVSLSGADRLLARMARDSSAGPLHHLLQMAAFGSLPATATTARLASALAGIATVVLILALRRLGLPRTVALCTAAVIALSPAHVGFARDATQYSLVVLVAVAVFGSGFALLDPRRRDRTGWRLLFAVACGLAPWAGYQTVLVALASLVALPVASRLAVPRADLAELRTVATGAVPLGISSTLAYVLVARDQMRVLGQWYLAEGYPTTSTLTPLRWLVAASDGFMAVVAGGQVTGRWSASQIDGLRAPISEGAALGWLALSLLLVGAALLLHRAFVSLWHIERGGTPPSAVEGYVLGAAVALVLGSILAATIGLYPFGGMHQQLHATPVVLLGCMTAARMVLLRTPRPLSGATIASAAVLFAGASIPALPPVYAEREDIVSAIRVGVDGRGDRGMEALDDSLVWIYRDARPAVRFHFPGRAFRLSSVEPTDLDGMLQEIVALASSGEAVLVFSQIHPHPEFGDHRRALQVLLLAEGWTITEEIHHPNTVALGVVAPDPARAVRR